MRERSEQLSYKHNFVFVIFILMHESENFWRANISLNTVQFLLLLNTIAVLCWQSMEYL